ncbi:acetyl/propionyl/methylcrotonyl-CoA carboxylase subunit alpha [Shinella sp. 838]|jgi:3-methylcrotonyl-CoA carboxylase alpha subunit|uniref:acetyl/propionyl/methylcrotonyl-CoA carboxylase subunit alpha n=2 Tax=Shinella TaxID=323620 RepID=UPI000437C8F7|nr:MULTISPECIES: acetyl/propionyl/methylcrotonyl-CoA carboxylase subunit alpha [unclassified Shinella]EYR83399.1 carbamoyl-phosphate synthase L chain ATP-binding protein [Shinella sp. DD12]MDG4672152.1 acetyl/propionyl/methylcrotonyl-CoA carboxylase subunit alpha [Shinella sp. 838]
MFRKILIANRGEIACRVIGTARRMGVATVAVYSDADRQALHAAMADEAIRIGPAEAAGSYLNSAAIVAAAKASGAEAVHPGYGFLSENPDFVEAVEAAGLVFIGPSASAIRAMGLKDAAKALMEKAGVPVVPGYHGERQEADFLAGEAEAIGYPVLIKARAGGGGKGMRRVERPADFTAALESARREAESAFGDGRVLVEKYMAKPRHIEVQVFGDGHGNVVHLFERDCSLQRRHQKVIEEAPAPGMTAEMRVVMGEAAVRAAAAIGYSGAGTVEFIADVSEGLRQDRFYFMEMNTRLQVEHPVTEAITGLDLVEWQLRVAAGDPLPRRQDELVIDGWAFEARLYAENPARDFLPATGRLTVFDLPGEARIDSGVRVGDIITPYYDPMIAKVITHGRNRREALARLEAALEACRVGGLTTNAGFLARLCRLPAFAAGDVDTGLIGRAGEGLLADPEAAEEVFALAALSALGFLDAPADPDPWSQVRGFRLWSEATRSVFLDHGGAEHALRITFRGVNRFRVEHAGFATEIGLLASDGRSVRADVDGRILSATVHRDGADTIVFLGGHAHAFSLTEEAGHEGEAAAGGDRLSAPMPGLVRIVSVAPGARVTRGDALVTMEAMKMELVLAAPRDGVVAVVPVAVGDQVAEGALLLALEPEEAT